MKDEIKELITYVLDEFPTYIKKYWEGDINIYWLFVGFALYTKPKFTFKDIEDELVKQLVEYNK